jgi:alpha-tubulin suppressor-like RCC1 family protein
LFLKKDGTVWGIGRFDTLGLNNHSYTLKPVQLPHLRNISAITAGGTTHNLAIQKDGKILAWAARICMVCLEMEQIP